jgi:hypothetical protein
MEPYPNKIEIYNSFVETTVLNSGESMVSLEIFDSFCRNTQTTFQSYRLSIYGCGCDASFNFKFIEIDHKNKCIILSHFPNLLISLSKDEYLDLADDDTTVLSFHIEKHVYDAICLLLFGESREPSICVRLKSNSHLHYKIRSSPNIGETFIEVSSHVSFSGGFSLGGDRTYNPKEGRIDIKYGVDSFNFSHDIYDRDILADMKSIGFAIYCQGYDDICLGTMGMSVKQASHK